MGMVSNGQVMLVVNTSPTLLALAGELGPLVDGIKVGDWVDEPLADAIRTAYPGRPLLYHHWHLYTTPDQPPDGALDVLCEAWERFHSPWLSGHIDQVSWQEILEIVRGDVPPPQHVDVEAAVEWNCAAARVLKETLPVPLLLENMPHWPHDVPHEAVRPAFIRAVLEQVDVPMLLDLAHARVSAAALGISSQDYLAALPLERVQEIHVSGPRKVNGRLRDAHEPLESEDYELLRWTLGRTMPRAVTLEYIKPEPESLRTMVQKLAEILGKAG